MFLFICFVCVGIVEDLVVRVRVCLTTFIAVVVVVVVVVVFAGTIQVVLGSVFVSFECTAMILIVTWFFAKVTSWFGFLWTLWRGLLRRSVHLQLLWSFQTIQFQLLFKI